MAKQRSDSNKWSVFGLEFLGSIIYLVVALTGGSVFQNGSTGVWEPMLVAVALTSAIVLFFMNFGNFGAFERFAARGAFFAAVAGGFSLIALTVTSGGNIFFMSLVGLVLSIIGSGLAHGE